MSSCFGMVSALLQRQAARATSGTNALRELTIDLSAPAAAGSGASLGGVYSQLAVGGEITAQSKEQWPSSPGGLARHRLEGMPMGSAEMVKGFHDVMGKTGFIWAGDAKVGSEGKFLDGLERTGQCLSLVRAFKLLMTAPAPYGFGADPTKFEVITYAGGPEKCGFLADHPPAGVLSCRGNIAPPADSNEQLRNQVDGFPDVSGLRFWDNHKVLQSTAGGNTTYLDPSYGRVYNSLEQMARARVKEVVRTKGGGEYFSVEFGGQLVYFRDTQKDLLRLIGPYKQPPA